MSTYRLPSFDLKSAKLCGRRQNAAYYRFFLQNNQSEKRNAVRYRGILVHISSRNTLILGQIHKTFKLLCRELQVSLWPPVYLHKPQMLPNHISIICTRPLGRIDNVALKRWALFTVE